MSLSRAEAAQTSRELHEAVERARLTPAQICADLSWSTEEFETAIAVDANPVDTWLLRDYLHQAIVDTGGEPVEHSILTAQARRQATQWFDLQTPPHHAFGADDPTG